MLNRLKIIPSLLGLGVIYIILVLLSIPLLMVYIITGKKIIIKLGKIEYIIKKLEKGI